MFTINLCLQGGEWTILRTAPTAVHFTNYFSGVKTKKNEMGGACGTYGAEESYIRGFDGQT